MTPLPAPTRSSSDNSAAYAGVPTHSVEACSKGDVARASQHLTYEDALRSAEARASRFAAVEDLHFTITFADMRSPAHVKAWAARKARQRANDPILREVGL